MRSKANRRLALWAACGIIGLGAANAFGLPRTWIGGNADWLDGGAIANWSPNDEPDFDDEAIFNTPNTVNLGSNNTVNGLTMSGGIDLSTNDFALTVDGLVSLSGAGTNLFIRNALGSVNADDVTIDSGAAIDLRGGVLTLDEEVGTSLLQTNLGGALIGTGTIQFTDVPGVATTVLSNNGTLTARSVGGLITPPPAGTLTINANVGFSRVDLDGSSNTGVVNVNRNQTLDLNGSLSDDFNGTMNLFHNSTFDSLSGWTFATGGAITVDNGFIAGTLGSPDVPADVAYIKGGPLTMNGGTITVADTDGTLQFDANLTVNAGTISNAGTVLFNGVTNINAAASYDPSNVNSQTIVNADVTINDATANFNWDGNGGADTTINGTAQLSITAAQIDTTDNAFGGAVFLNDDADLSVNVGATEWTLVGAIVKNGAGTSTVTGDRIVIDGPVTANAGTLNLPAVTTTAGGSVTANALVALGTGSELAGGLIDGTGTLRMSGASIVLSSTTIGTATFDWDGIGTGTMHTINSGAVFTINSPTIDTDGDMDDPFTLAGNGAQLVVSGPTEWTMNGIVTANASTAGTATIGGTSRMILAGTMNVDGDTNVNAPITFSAGSTTSIDAGKTLNVGLVNATYAGGTISGAGTFSPGSTNSVTGTVVINAAVIDLDGGTWSVEPTGDLNVNSTDYDTTATNVFDGVISVNRGRFDINSGDASFVMDGTLNMSGVPGDAAIWDGEPLQIGNDAGTLDANLSVTGSGNGDFVPTSVTFNSDADVNVAAGATLAFLSGTPVTFNTVNGANDAEFTGAGEIEFTGAINVNEAVTFNMPGGTIDFDSADFTGAVFNVDAPFTINAASVQPVGNSNSVGGPDTFDVNNSVGTGVLTVNLDNPAGSWTLNPAGVMNLVNDNITATLLAGSTLNMNGTLNVTGDVRSDARLVIAGTVNINTPGQPFRLSGGGTGSGTANRLVGGTISGVGILGCDLDSGLRGFGTINTDIDFDANANLFAEDGVLTINGAILDMNTLGTGNAGGTLNIPAAWATGGPINAVELNGGVLQGGTITNDGANGIAGFGLVTSRVINNQNLTGRSGTLVVQTAANDNDWDGVAGNGRLRAAVGSTLEVRDNGVFGFTGLVDALPGGRVFANGFTLDFNAGSTIQLSAGTFESTNNIPIAGTVTVAAGAPSTLKTGNSNFLTFESTSSTTLTGNLLATSPNVEVDAGATFAGTGSLVIPSGSGLVTQNTVNINVLVAVEGRFRPNGFNTAGRTDVKDYQQAATGELFVNLGGSGLAQFDRVVVNGNAQIAGALNVSLIGGYTPGYLVQHSVLTSLGLTGSFSSVSGLAISPTRYLAVTYTATSVNVTAALPGDANLNGTVNFDDLLFLAANYNGTGKTWSLGDFTGDAATNFDDLLLLAANYNQSITPGAGEWALAQTAVPEPGVLLTSAIGAAAMLRRRRR